MTVDCLMCSRELGIELIKERRNSKYWNGSWSNKRGCSLEQESVADESCGLIVDRAR